MNKSSTGHSNYFNFLLSWVGWWVAEVLAEIKAISAQLSWRLAGWLGLNFAKLVHLIGLISLFLVS